jgi:hypothetical protein
VNNFLLQREGKTILIDAGAGNTMQPTRSAVGHSCGADTSSPGPRHAISTAAMDDLEGTRDVKADQRVDQFVRLRDAIEERAARKFFEEPAETKGPVVLRSNDFFK